MIESIHFKNFKVLRDTTLPLGPFTLIVGPNGSGKSTALQALEVTPNASRIKFDGLVTVGLDPDSARSVEVLIAWKSAQDRSYTRVQWKRRAPGRTSHTREQQMLGGGEKQRLDEALAMVRVYALDASAIAAPVALHPNMVLEQRGGALAGVLDRLRDRYPERFDALNDELGRWLPEFDRVLFDTPAPGDRAIALRTRDGHHKIAAHDVSQGTLLALTILTLAYIPDPPWFVGFEEPDRGIHPRLLRDVRDALYRLAYPQDCGEDRDPVQVVATTHSPYFVDLFRDHPEEIVIAEKVGQEARFVRLTDLPNVEEILKDAHLGDAWYSGILGGVPIEP